MRPTRRARRLMALFVLTVAGLAPCLGVLGYGIYLRSPLYRAAVERDLSAFFGLPVRVGRAISVGRGELLLHDVEIFLPAPSGRLAPDNRVAFCRTAQWLRREQPGQFDLLLSDGQIDLTPARWAQGDFDRLEQSLRHDYRALGLHKVSIHRGRLRWAHQAFSLELGDADGEVWFVGEGPAVEGVARLRAGSLNGEPADIVVDARFDPLSEALVRRDVDDIGLVRQFDLSTSPDRPAPLPLRQLGLDELVGGPVHDGQFSGRLRYRARQDGRRNVFTLTDAQLSGLQLAEFTRTLPGGPVPGRVDLKVAALQLEQFDPAGPDGGDDRFHVTALRFSGVLSDLDLAKASEAVGLARLPGSARVEVLDADLMGTLDEAGRPGPVWLVSAAASARGLDLGELTGLAGERFGGGRIRGPARVDRFQIVIANGRLLVLQGDLTAQPTGPDSPPAVVDTALIRAAAPWLTGLPIGLPESLAYESLRLSALLSEGKLIVQGLGGSDGKSLMTLLIPTPAWSRALGAGEHIRFDVPAPGAEKPFSIDPLAKELARPLRPIPLQEIGRTVRLRLLPPPDAAPD